MNKPFKKKRFKMETRVLEADMSKANLNAAIENFLRQMKVIQDSEDLITVDLGILTTWDSSDQEPVHCKFTIQKVKDGQ